MTVSKLVCPECNCPLSPPSGASTAVSCPRCNTWVELDPLCLGSCMSCHKLHQTESHACVEVTIEKTPQKGVKK